MLEAGSTIGLLVHAPLADAESFQVTFDGEGRYRFAYSVNPTGARWEPIFTVTFILPVGGLGRAGEEVTMHLPSKPDSTETAKLMTRMFIVPEDLGTPAGAVTLRGAWNFETAGGWDTVYAPIFNLIERPVAPGFVIRVETDWYAHDTEFRYVLQPGESLSASHGMPIGQVFFMPREEITLRNGTADEANARLSASEAFFREKVGVKQRTPYGLDYSPHYLRTSRQRATTSSVPSAPPVSEPPGHSG